ncbi:MAG: J domain-containing protein [Pseudolabrys sp.]
MASSRAIDMALDLARMPAFAPSMSASPLPAGVLEVIRIAAESPEACRAAALATGKPEPVLVEASRFYLQQVLFKEEADCYRILGIRPDEPREQARDHMRWLLRWLHPDRNGGWDAVYAKRIVGAWREVSQGSSSAGILRPKADMPGKTNSRVRRTRRSSNAFRIPWIAQPYENGSKRGRKYSYSPFAVLAIKVVAGLVAVLVFIGFAAPASTLRIISDLW